MTTGRGHCNVRYMVAPASESEWAEWAAWADARSELFPRPPQYHLLVLAHEPLPQLHGSLPGAWPGVGQLWRAPGGRGRRRAEREHGVRHVKQRPGAVGR
eukprot:scaffold39663_cov50-Phaeocystis_antarctica.AAC.2